MSWVREVAVISHSTARLAVTPADCTAAQGTKFVLSIGEQRFMLVASLLVLHTLCDRSPLALKRAERSLTASSTSIMAPRRSL